MTAYQSPRTSLLFWPAIRAALLGGCLAGCGGGVGMKSTDGYDKIKFKDDAQSNTEVKPKQLSEMSFVDGAGKTVDLKPFVGKKNVVLVVTRGYVGSEKPNEDGKVVGSFCLYCSTQTSRLIANYDEFRKRQAEVLVVFPVAHEGDKIQMNQFLAKVQQKPQGTAKDVPFPLLLDPELHVVDQLGIRADLSKPATYILDKAGQMRFAYVGQHMADRPSVKALLTQLDVINASPP